MVSRLSVREALIIWVDRLISSGRDSTGGASASREWDACLRGRFALLGSLCTGQRPPRLREQDEVRECEGDAGLDAVPPGSSVPRPPKPEEVLDGAGVSL